MPNPSRTRRPRAELLSLLEREIRRASAQGALFGQAVADRLAINATDMDCLDLIALGEPVTAGQLATATGLTTGAVTGIIDRLETAGYVRRVRDPADRRRVIVQPLPRMGRKLAPLFAPLQQAMLVLWSSYSDQQLALLLEFYSRSLAILSDETAKLRAVTSPRGAKRAKPSRD
jgi:DNA-binding MarR family transcriptional regulator